MNTAKLRVPGARPLPRHPMSHAVPTPTHRTSRSRGGSASSEKLSRSVRSAKSTSRPRTSKLSADVLLPVRSGTDELEHAWDFHAVPDFHRQEVRQALAALSATRQNELVGKELNDLSRRQEPIQLVLAAVTQRESLIAQLYELESRIGEERDELLQRQSGEVLEKLRTLSLSVVEHILAWRSRLGKPSVFLWKGQNYLVKMRSDLNFLQQSALSAYFYFAEGSSDPFLLHAAGPRTFSRTRKDSRTGLLDRKKQLQLSSRLLDRIKQAEIVLNAEARSSSPLPFSLLITQRHEKPPLLHSESASTVNSLPGIPTLPFLAAAAATILEDIVECEVALCSKAVAAGTFREMIAATMLLHSNFILDNVISAALAMDIPICAKEAYGEELDIEYIFFQKRIITQVVNSECESSALLWALEVIAEEITREYTYAVELNGLAEEAVHEEIQLNQDMMEEIYAGIVTDLIDREWLELLAEDEYSHSVMEDRFNSLPLALVNKLIKSDLQKHLWRLSENIYVDYLYEYVSGNWLQRLVRSELSLQSSDDSEVFFIEKPPEEPPKKASKFRTSYYG